jgi:predicted transcriptional regulator of viral defense system
MQMKHYEKLIDLGCFSRSDIATYLGNDATAASLLRDYLKKGYIERVRRDLYAVISLETDQPIASRFQIASRAAADACVSYHSAFEFFGYANQVFYEVYVAVPARVRPFVYDGISYVPVQYQGGTGVVETDTGVCVTSLERTVIDCIAVLSPAGGLEEFLRCLALIPSLDEKGLLDALDMYGRSQLYQKAGYILSAYQDDLMLPDGFFAACEKRSSASKTYLTEDRRGYVLHPRWKLYTPADLKALVNKGAMDYDAV